MAPVVGRHRVGLCGAHRTGKTTLAREVEKVLELPFLETRTSTVFAELGYDPKADYDFDTRLFIQGEILRAAERIWRGKDRFVTDRTPLDMLAYTLADVQRANLSAEHIPALLDYMAACFAVTNRLFTTLVIVNPGIPVVEVEKSAPGNMGYIEHIAGLVRGLVVDERQHVTRYFIPGDCLALERRVKAVANALRSTNERAVAEVAARVLH